MRVLILCSFFFSLSSTVSAQSPRQAENWHFGMGISIRFVDDAPVLDPPSAMEAFEGACSLSDTLGNLLFYSNGGGRLPGNGGPDGEDQDYGTIWNRNHEVLYDMRGEEGGGFSARQPALAFPAPGDDPDRYVLLTMEEAEFDVGGSVPGQPQGRGLSYFIVDRSLNGGLGGVVEADVRVYVPAYEALDATPMREQDGYWIVTHNNRDDAAARLIVVPFTAEGAGTPVEVEVPGGVGSRIKFSPDGTLLYLRGTVYAFDPASGNLGTTVATLPSLGDNNATFTPDSRYLYGTQAVGPLSNVVVRYEVATGEMLPVEPLEQPGESAFAIGSFQIGPNGNVYFVEQNVGAGGITSWLSEIQCVSGAVPSVQRRLLDLTPFQEDGIFPSSLPQYVDAIFTGLTRQDTTVLDTVLTVICPQFSGRLEARVAGSTYRWSTGDTTATILVPTSGEYCVTITDECGSVTIDCQQARIESDANEPEVVTSFVEDCRQFCVVRLNTEATFDSITVIAGFTIPNGIVPPFFEGIFFRDSLVFPKLPEPGAGQSPYIDAYIRSDCGVQRISLLRLPFEPPPPFTARIELFESTETCTGQTIELEVVTDGETMIDSVRWEDGSTVNPRQAVAAPDTEYSAMVFSECGDTAVVAATPFIQEFCDCDDRIPEVITPNGDGLNDRFRLFSSCPVSDYTLLVYNRWGQVVYRSSDPGVGWDGTTGNTPANPDTYLYRIVFRYPESDELQTREGQFALLR